MRLLATADLHFNHPRSRDSAIELINTLNRRGWDVLLLVGDTAPAESAELRECLARFEPRGRRLIVAGNHELWSHATPAVDLLDRRLPEVAGELGWHCLDQHPLVVGDIAFVGSVGWYDYSMAPADLMIPRRFYQAKVSPGAAQRLSEHAQLLEGDDITPASLDIVARWNDGRYVHLPEGDAAFLERIEQRLRQQLEAVQNVDRVIAAIHHLPFNQLLPPRRTASWDFAKAYLGSPRLGELLLAHPNVSDVLTGHAHFPIGARVGHIRAQSAGGGYTQKTFVEIDL